MKVGDLIRLKSSYVEDDPDVQDAIESEGDELREFFDGTHRLVRRGHASHMFRIHCPGHIGWGDGYWRVYEEDCILVEACNPPGPCECKWEHCRRKEVSV